MLRTGLASAIALSNPDQKEAAGALTLGLKFPDELLRGKISARQQVVAQAQIQVPDADIQAAFDWGKLNLTDMRRTVREVMVRDTMEGKVYPPHSRPHFPFFPASELDTRIIPGSSAPTLRIAPFPCLQLASGKKQRII